MSAFATTRWSRVLAAGEKNSSRAAQVALAELCEQYWYPLYAYVRRRGHGAEDAQDLTQAFFAKLLEKRDLAHAEPSRGRFRTFLLTAMKNFLAGEWRKQGALKRGGAAVILALDFDSAEETYQLEPCHDQDPEALYHRRWALDVLERALTELRQHYDKTGRGELFEALKGAVSGGVDLPYAELASKLEMSEGALRTAASRLRSRWRRRLRDMVAETVGPTAGARGSDEAEAEKSVHDELQILIAALG